MSTQDEEPRTSSGRKGTQIQFRVDDDLYQKVKDATPPGGMSRLLRGLLQEFISKSSKSGDKNETQQKSGKGSQ